MAGHHRRLRRWPDPGLPALRPADGGRLARTLDRRARCAHRRDDRLRRPPPLRGPRQTRDRQALDGRRGRQSFAPPRANGRELRRRRADDVRPWPRSHRRHARQARIHPRLSDRPLPPRSGSPGGADRLCHDRPDSRDCAGRSKALRVAGRHRDGRVDSAHLREHHVQEAGGRPQRPGARREDRLRGLPARGGASHRAGPDHDRSRGDAGLSYRRTAHRDGPAAGAGLRQRAGGRGGAAGSRWRRPGRPDGGDLCARRRDAAARRG